jgi:membrane-associated protease RseP (regulator of RpoE activity)
LPGWRDMLFTIGILVLLELSLVVHELGHAFAMRQCGVRILRISLFGFPGLSFISVPVTIRLPIRARWLPDTEWVIHPLLPLGAYVMPHEEDAARVSRAQDLYISGMGALTNFIFGLALIGLTAGVAPEWFVSPDSAASMVLYAGLLIIIAAAMWLLWRYRVFFCRRLLLAVGIVSLVLVVLMIVTMTQAERMEMLADFGFLVSIKEFYVWSQEFANTGVKDTIAYTLVISGGLSIGLGALNLMPLLPLDGGHMMNHYMPRVLRTPYSAVSVVLVYPLLVLSLWNDAMLVKNLFWA